jgi:hypothetical protein
LEVFIMAHAFWHPVVGTTPLSEEEAWQGQGVDTAYTGAPDPGIEIVAPELLLGGAARLAAKGVMGAARPLWNVGKRALTTKSPVTGNTILRPAIQKGLSRARTSVVRPGYGGAARKGAMVRGPQGQLRRAKFAGEGAYAPRLGPAGYVAGGLGLGYAANKEEVDNMVSGMLGGTPEEQVTAPPKVDSVIAPGITQARVGSDIKDGVSLMPLQPRSVTDAGFQADVATLPDYSGDMYNISPVGNLPADIIPDKKPANKEELGETPENTPSLWKTWGSLADDPKKRRDAYLGSIRNIFMKKMLLDSIANLTGGKSQGDSWAKMAIAELDAVEKFDSEQRLHNQWKALFFREDGTYDPPKNRKEAMERGGQLGYDSDQMKDIMTVFPKETDDRTNIEKNISYILSLEDGSMKTALMKQYGLMEDEKDDRTSFEKFVERGVNSGLITKEQGDQSLKDKLVGTDSGLTAAQDNFNWYQSILAEGDEEKIAVANKFLNINGQKAATLKELLRLYTSQTFQDSDTFSPEEKATLEELIKKATGLGVSTVTTDSPSGITITKKP